jgi:hypothetical protein
MIAPAARMSGTVMLPALARCTTWRKGARAGLRRVLLRGLAGVACIGDRGSASFMNAIAGGAGPARRMGPRPSGAGCGAAPERSRAPDFETHIEIRETAAYGAAKQ